MDADGNVILEPVWENVYSTNEDGTVVLRDKQLTSFADAGYIAADTNLYYIPSGETIQIPRGTIKYLKGNMLVVRDYSTSGKYMKEEVTVYDIHQQKTVDGMDNYAKIEKSIPLMNVEEVGELGFYLETIERYDSDREEKAYPRYGFYSFDGTVIIKSSSYKPVIYEEYMIIATPFNEPAPGRSTLFSVYNLENGQQISQESFVIDGERDSDTRLPVVYDADGQHVMLVQKYQKNGKQFAIINMDLKEVILLPESIKKTEPFSDGLAAVQDESGKWGYINSKGEFVFECQFDEARPFENGITTTILNYKKVTLNKDGTIAD